MSIEYLQVLQDAQARSLDANYLPEQSKDITLIQAVVQQVNDQQINLRLAVTISTSATVGPTAFHTVAGTNTKAQGFLLLMYAENSTGAASGGTLNFTLNWTRNGAPEADTVSLALGPGTSSNYNGGYYFINADIGTDITYEYTTTITASETAAVKMQATLLKLI